MENESTFIGLIFAVMAVIVGVIAAFGTLGWVLVKFL